MPANKTDTSAPTPLAILAKCAAQKLKKLDEPQRRKVLIVKKKNYFWHFETPRTMQTPRAMQTRRRNYKQKPLPVFLSPAGNVVFLYDDC